jgi:hypothetical protein
MRQNFTKTTESAFYGGAMGQQLFEKRVSLRNYRWKRKFLMTAMLFIVFCSISICSFAQDVIVLKTGNEIQALVQEIGLNDVKYKKFDNQAGPVYMLKKSEIFMIKYVNGSKDVFTSDEITPVTTSTSSANSQSTNQSEDQILSYEGKLRIHNRLGKELEKEEVRSIMASVPTALELYNSGVTNRTWGYIFAGVGITADVIALGCFLSSLAYLDDEYYDFYTDSYPKADARLRTGWIFFGVGLGCLVGELVCIQISNKKLASSVRVYNDAIYNRKNLSDLSLNFGVTRSGGIGLTLSF